MYTHMREGSHQKGTPKSRLTLSIKRTGEGVKIVPILGVGTLWMVGHTYFMDPITLLEYEDQINDFRYIESI